MLSAMATARTVVMVNPFSQGGRTKERWPKMERIIRDQIGPFETLMTSAPREATTLTREALRQGADLVVAVGGDGTINEVVNGFFEGDRPLRPESAFGILSAGTGGDFVRTLGIPRELESAARLLHQVPARPLDVGRLCYTSADGKETVRHFINIASFGISGLVDRYVNQSKKSFGGTLSFAWATLKAGARYENAEVLISFDGGTPRRGLIYNVAVANGRYFGGGMKVAPGARLDDGLFDIVTISDIHFSDLLLRGADIYSGRHLKNPKVKVIRARRVEAEPLRKGSEVLLEVDGEQVGRLPARFEVIPAGLLVRAPAAS
jgi:diacylglycerol kinase (ATP)